MKRVLRSLIAVLSVAVASLVLSPRAGATICAMDDAPGATLLIPYFEADVSAAGCGNSNAKTTRFTVRNVEAEALVAYATVWSDWAVPVLGFSIYLAGHDEQTVDLHTVLCEGTLPRTGKNFSNHGALSDPPEDFPGCNNGSTPGNPPAYPPGAIDSVERAHLQAWLTGEESPLSSDCAGRSYGDEVARGYITVDVATACFKDFPSQPSYYQNGYLSFDNKIQGEFDIREAGGVAVSKYRAVALEANPSLTGILAGPTFYGRYNSNVVGFEYSDGREPLPTAFGGRWDSDAGEFSSLLVWREVDKSDSAVTCGNVPGWSPLDTSDESGAGAVVHLDDEANPFFPASFGAVEWYSFPEATQRTSAFPPEGSPFDTGWNYLNLESTAGAIDSKSKGQAWVIVEGPAGAFDHSHPATILDNQCPITTVFSARPTLDDLGAFGSILFFDGFESGGVTVWSDSVP